ncbi:MAG: RNA polymerase sigma factor [Candidatus Doudnabacteria bacterium]|nr:RNA polymerase sigma factor [Candidatus Doudnabacteria bacterium]
METNDLAVLAKNGNETAFEQLYERFAQRTFSFIRRKIQNRQDAEDVLQEVFIKTYKGMSSLRPGTINFTAWLFKIASNTINDHLRKKYRQPEIIGIDENFEIPDRHSLFQSVLANSDLETARANIQYLPPKHRHVLELRFFKELPIKEVAKALNKSCLAVRLLQYRARKKLYTYYERETLPAV